MEVRKAVEAFILACRADGLSPRTVETYDVRLRRLVERLGDHQIADVSIADLRAFAASLYEEDLSIHTVHGHIRALRRFFNWLVEEEIIADNPAQRIRLPHLPAASPKAISAEDARKLLQAANEMGKDWERKRNRAIILFLADTGCRLGGLVRLRTDDLDLEQRVAKVREKGGQWRFVFLKSQTVEALVTWLEARDLVATEAKDAVWVSRRGTPLTRWGVQNMLRRLKKCAGVAGPANAHSFRHGFAVSYLLNGGDLATLSDLLGHHDIETTKQYYARFRKEELQKKHDRYSPVDALL